jgi:hypothetical protein
MAKLIKVDLERLDSAREVRQAKQKRARELKQERDNLLLAESIRVLFPLAPKGEAEVIANHAARIGSRHVGRASGLETEEQAYRATFAHVRHNHTDYEERLRYSYGHGKREICREEVVPQIKKVLTAWREGETA